MDDVLGYLVSLMRMLKSEFTFFTVCSSSRLSNEKQHTYRTESSGSIKGDTYRSRANSKVSKEILHQSLELQPEVFPSPRGSSAAPSNCPSAETNEDIEDKLLEGDDSDNVDNIQQGTCRISTPFYTNGSFTSSTDLDKFGLVFSDFNKFCY